MQKKEWVWKIRRWKKEMEEKKKKERTKSHTVYSSPIPILPNMTKVILTHEVHSTWLTQDDDLSLPEEHINLNRIR